MTETMTESDAQATPNGHESEYSFGEHIIALFSSVCVGYLAWGGLWLTVVIYKWIPTLLAGVPELKDLDHPVYKPVDDLIVNLFRTDINLFFIIPLAFGILAGLINYGKVLKLEDN